MGLAKSSVHPKHCCLIDSSDQGLVMILRSEQFGQIAAAVHDADNLHGLDWPFVRVGMRS